MCLIILAHISDHQPKQRRMMQQSHVLHCVNERSAVHKLNEEHKCKPAEKTEHEHMYTLTQSYPLSKSEVMPPPVTARNMLRVHRIAREKDWVRDTASVWGVTCLPAHGRSYSAHCECESTTQDKCNARRKKTKKRVMANRDLKQRCCDMFVFPFSSDVVDAINTQWAADTANRFMHRHIAFQVFTFCQVTERRLNSFAINLSRNCLHLKSGCQLTLI